MEKNEVVYAKMRVPEEEGERDGKREITLNPPMTDIGLI